MTAVPLADPPVARPSLGTLVLIAAISPLAINMFVPSMPSIAADLNAPYATIQLGLSLFLFSIAAIQLFIGPASDRYGRKPVLVGGILFFLAGSLLCLFAQNATMFLTGRLIQSAAAVGIVLSRAIVRDVYPREKSASMIGYVVMGMSIAPMIGPAIGGLLEAMAGWRATFVALTAFGVLALFMVSRLPETNANIGQSPRQQLQSYRALLGTGHFWLYTLSAGLASAVFFSFLGGGPAVSSTFFNQTPFEYGIYFSSCAIGYSAGNFLTGRYSETVGIEPMMFNGTVITLLGPVISLILFKAGFSHPAALFVPMILVGLGNGLTIPNVTAAAISLRPEAAGAASGLLGALQLFISAVASMTGAWAAGVHASPDPLVITMLIFALAALAITFAATRVPPAP